MLCRFGKYARGKKHSSTTHSDESTRKFAPIFPLNKCSIDVTSVAAELRLAFATKFTCERVCKMVQHLRDLARDRQFGGVAVEYLLVTLFAAATSVGALVAASNLVKSRIGTISERLGIDAKDLEQVFPTLGDQ
jgi:hypothetical protein